MKAWREEPVVDRELTPAEAARIVGSWHCVECGRTFTELEAYRDHVHRDDAGVGCWIAVVAGVLLWLVSVAIAAAMAIGFLWQYGVLK